jgi:signal transduction histidine kinase
MTNGIRHGGSSRFHFRLAFGSGVVDFTLRNNGSVPRSVQFGFGLSALQNQVELVHGTLSLQEAPDGGMELRIRLPMSGSERRA